MSLSATLADYKNQDCFIIYNPPPKHFKVSNQSAFVPLGTTSMYTTEESLTTLTPKYWWIYLNNYKLHTNSMQTLLKWTVPIYVYKSICVESHYSTKTSS